MGSMNLVEYRADIRTELSDSATFFSDAEIDRGVEKTESLLGRLLPKKAVYEATYTATITDEALTIASNTGTLANIPVKYNSEAVVDGSSVTQIRNTDYTINYMTGVVTEIGALLPDGAYTVTYTVDPKRINLTTPIPDPIKITRIEYPVGDQPPTYLGSFDWIFNTIILHGNDLLSDGRNYRIYYDSKWTGAIVTPDVWVLDTVIALNEVRRPTTANATGFYYECTVRAGDFKTGGTEPTWGTTLGGTTVDDAITWTCISISDADGEYPAHLDDAIIVGASGQTLIFKAEKYVQSAVTELGLVNAAADSMATPLADINTALDKVDTHVTEAGTALTKVALYLETNDTTDNAKDVLANITDDAAELRTAIETALDKSSTYLTNASTPPSAHDYLVDGDDYIITINQAEQVAEKYADYARASVQIYMGLVSEATIRLDNIRTYIEEAQSWMRMGDAFANEGAQRLGQANTFVNEAVQRVNEVSAWAIQAEKYEVTTREYLNIAGRYLASGQAKINEFYALLGFKPELKHTSASSGQPTQY